MPRTASFDYARLLAAFGIVLFHAGAPGAAIGYAALPFFLMVMVVMGAEGCQSHGWGRYSWRRMQRLLVPWLIWSGVYGGLKILEVLLTPASLDTEFAPFMLLTGPALHLWFLPFACVACILTWPVLRLAPRFWDAAVLACVVIALLILGARQTLVVEAPIAQWLYAGPAVALGAALALRRHAPRDCAVIIATFTGVAMAAGWTSGLMQLALAGGLFVLCQIWKLPVTPVSQSCAGAALGVYLAHPMALSVLERITPLTGETVGLAALAAITSLMGVVVWRHKAGHKGSPFVAVTG